MFLYKHPIKWENDDHKLDYLDVLSFFRKMSSEMSSEIFKKMVSQHSRQDKGNYLHNWGTHVYSLYH